MSTIHRADRKLWESARTLTELGEGMALWLEGEIKSRPGYYGPTDLDTPSLTRLCAALCRAGFVTDNSQRGGHWDRDGREVWARDALSGFCDDTTLDRLYDAVSGTGLIVSARRTTRCRWRWRAHRHDDDGRVWVTEVDGHVCTTFGGQMGRRDLDSIWGGVGKQAWHEVCDAWHVGVADFKWGRTDLLTPTLTQRFLLEEPPSFEERCDNAYELIDRALQCELYQRWGAPGPSGAQQDALYETFLHIEAAQLSLRRAVDARSKAGTR